MAGPGFSWTQDPWRGVTDARGGQGRGNFERLAWSGAIAFAVFALLTAGPAYSMPFGCLMCGWDEILAARWLKKTDPDRTRGRICSRFYLAWGLWRVSLVGAALMFGIIIAQQAIEGRPAKGSGDVTPPPEFVGCGVTTMIGFLLSSAASCLAVVSALRHRVRVWVGPEARWARADGAWPPHLARHLERTTNRTKVVLIGALIPASALGLMIVLLPLSFLIPREFKSPINLIWIVLFTLSLMIGLPVTILLLLDRLGARMIAATPSACWSRDAEVDDRRA